MPTVFDGMLTIECGVCGRRKFCNGETESEAMDTNAHGWTRSDEGGITCPMCRIRQADDIDASQP